MNEKIIKLWENFVMEYRNYFMTAEESWNSMLKSAKHYINKYKKRPLQYDKNKINKKLGQWLSQQSNKYKKCIQCMKNVKIREKWEQFITEYKEYFPNNPTIQQKPSKKLTTIKINEPKKEKELYDNKQKRTLSEYQEITKKISTPIKPAGTVSGKK